MVGNDETLQHKLLLELIQYQKDVKAGHKFLTIFGVEKNLQRLPESTREFYSKNIEIFDQWSEEETDISAKNKFYYPHELLNEKNIHFVDSPESFEDMLSYFEAAQPQIIGLDCEWKYAQKVFKV